MWSAQHVRHRRQALPAVGIAVVPCGTRAAGLAVEVGARAAGRRRRRRRRGRRRRGDDAADEDSSVARGNTVPALRILLVPITRTTRPKTG